NRSANFNTRQNGYDIAADALGYPESYYTPPMQALERIEVLRGASSLQFGPQFAGMINFVFKQPEAGTPIAWEGSQTLGAFGFYGSYNRISGSSKKLSWQAFHQYRQGNGWRPNSAFTNQTAFGQLTWRPFAASSIRLEYTHMSYLAQQPGGLTDTQFAQDARQSLRERNWFRVGWNLAALTWDQSLSEHSKLNLRLFGNRSSREALGLLDRITVADFGQTRTLISDDYLNGGAELRWLSDFSLGQRRSTLLLGARAYHGRTHQRQGDGPAGAEADFRFAHPDLLEGSDFEFPNTNLAAFAEQIFRLGDRLTLTPGLRFEHIRTLSDGYYRQRLFDQAGNVVVDNVVEEENARIRSFLLAGLGLSFQAKETLELYANASQNYRAVTFSDLRIANPNFQVDPNIQDESGYTLDLGIRGKDGNLFRYDVSAYYLRYNDRIGLLLRADQPPLFLDYRLRTNIADSYTLGVEAVLEADVLRLLKGKTHPYGLVVFANGSFNHARYVNTSDLSILDKQVELVPALMLRSGITFMKGNFQAQYQLSFLSQQFTDATNAIRSSSAVNGLIPAYSVSDLTLRYRWRMLTLETGVNNLLDQRYFTRRAVSYPGPGIIPGEGRSWFVTVSWELFRPDKGS
ncbi:MAG: TonB-dependent receptor, partial [Bacteroidia bacterium]|nr:TonB-dependent receptor [Bacteroidia bacterium]